MIRMRTRLPRFFCTTRAMARVQVRSPAHPQFKRSYSSIKKADRKINQRSSTNNNTTNVEMNYLKVEMLKAEKEESPCGNNNNNNNNNRVMVIVDSTFEAKGALQWALSHSVQTQDTIILLHLTNSPISKHGGNNQRAYKLLSSMKNMCQLERPGVKVEIVVQQGKDKGPTIVEEAKEQRVSLLVLSQKKMTIMRRLRNKLGRRRTSNCVVEYCIKNASCMAIAVRRKSTKYGGGYLITTKSHKDFWLLA